MKTQARLFLFAGLAALAPAAPAQYLYVVNKGADFLQSSNTTAAPSGTSPYNFNPLVGGDPQSTSLPASAINVTTPAGGLGLQDLFFSANNTQWELKTPFASQAALDAADPNGTYLFNVGGVTGNISITGDLYPNTPLITPSDGVWSGGVLYVTPGQDLTLTTNLFSANFTAGFARVGITASGETNSYSGIYDSLNDPSPLMADQGNLTIPGADLLSGNLIDLKVEFNSFASYNPSGIGGGADVGMYTAQTKFVISTFAVPEPGAAALAAGLCGLGVALWRRRRV